MTQSPATQTDLTASNGFAFAYKADAPFWVYDFDTASILHANQSACRLWQAKDEAELVTRNIRNGMSTAVQSRLKQYQADFEVSDKKFREMWTLYPNGEPENAKLVFSGFRLLDGRMAMLCEVLGRSANEPENIRSTEALLHTDVMIALFEADGPLLYMNPAATGTFGNSHAQFSSLFVLPADYIEMSIAIEADGEVRQVVEILTNEGRRWFDLSMKRCTDAVTGKSAILATAIDVSELKNARDKASYLADRDLLTGCFNRTFLQNRFADFKSQNDTQRCAVLFFDIDKFKLINDRHGHEVGDAVLVQIANRARLNLRPDDIIARLGGDEFVILLRGEVGHERLAERTEELREAISRPIFHGKLRIDSTVSMGVVPFIPDVADFTTVLREADIALYTSKSAGRNCVTVFNEEMGKEAADRDTLEKDLEAALVRGEFVLHYQPRVDISSGKVVSVEGLVRWHHPERGIVMPGAFIPTCEETGMIEDLGRQVLEIGCRQAIRWHADGLKIDVSLNLSPRQFNDEGLLTLLSDYANSPGFPIGHVELEITESVLIGDHVLIAEKLNLIKKMGYRIAIDDFGTGYSNLSYISRFPLKCLKIDRSFIMQLPESGPIVSLILTLARELQATVVAEGVETQDQLDWLARNDCEQVQGYYLSRPIPLSELAGKIEELGRPDLYPLGAQ